MSARAPDYAYCASCHGWVGMDTGGGGPTESDIQRHRCLTDNEQGLACHGRPDRQHECSLAARRWPQGTIPRGDEPRHHVEPDYWYCSRVCRRLTLHEVVGPPRDRRIRCTEHYVARYADRPDGLKRSQFIRPASSLIAEDRRSDAREAMADVVDQAAAMDGE